MRSFIASADQRWGGDGTCGSVPAGNNLVVYNRFVGGTSSIDYVTSDHLGSPAVITDSAGNLVVQEKYSALGANEDTSVQQTTEGCVTRVGFTGQTQMDSIGMVNMNGRIYSYLDNHFLSPDPSIPHPTDTRSYNRYAYARYNPFTYTDPSGFVDCAPDDPLCVQDGPTVTCTCLTCPDLPYCSSPFDPSNFQCSRGAYCPQPQQPCSVPFGCPQPGGGGGGGQANSSPTNQAGNIAQQNACTEANLPLICQSPQGNQYKTLDAAGIRAACAYNPISMTPTASNPYGTEYSGFVYQNDNGTYSYTQAYPATTDSSGPSTAMTYYHQTPVAWFHTHGAFDPRYGKGNYLFSDITGAPSPDNMADIPFSNVTGKSNYMANPAKVYNPRTKSVTNFGSCTKYQ